MGSGKSTPNAFGRLFLMRRFTGRQAPTQPMLQKACLKKPAPIAGLRFYKQFGCQMLRFRGQDTSAFFSYILYLIIPLQPIAAGGNFGGNRYKNCVQRFFVPGTIEKNE
jgi:hypothetical protein